MKTAHKELLVFIYIGIIFLMLPVNEWLNIIPVYRAIYMCSTLGLLLWIPILLKGRLSLSWFDIAVSLLFACGLFAAWKYGILSEFVVYIHLYLAARILSFRPHYQKRLLVLLSVFGSIQSIIALLQWLQWIAPENSLFIVTGMFRNPATLGGLVACCVIASWVYILYYRPKGVRKYIWWGMMSLQSLSLLLSDSRAAWLSTLLAVSALSLHRAHWKKGWEAGVFVLITALFLAGSLYLYKPASARGRIMIWNVCIEMIQEYPILGSGWNTFAERYMPCQARYMAMHPEEDCSSFTSNNRFAFNEPLRIVCETGCIGFIYVSVLIGALWFSCAGKKKWPFLFPVLVGWLVFSCFSYPCNVFLLSALLCVVVCSLASFSPVSFRHASCLHRLGWGLWGLLFVGTTHAFIPRCEAENALDDYFYAGKEEALKKTEACYLHLIHVRDFVYRYAKSLFLMEDYERCIPVLLQAIQLYPSTDKYMDLGECYRQTGRSELAEACYKEASRLLPCLVEPTYCLLLWYEQTGEREKAAEAAWQILHIKSPVRNETVERIKLYAKRYLEKRF